MENKKRVCIYIRVSTTNETQDISYNETQEKIIRELIEKNKDEEFNPETDIFRERVSGTSFQSRKEFKRILSLCGLEVTEINKNKKIDYSVKTTGRKPLYNKIYVKSYSRFSRDFFGETVLNTLKAYGIEIFFFDTRKSSFNIDFTQLKIDSLVSEQFSHQISYNWRLYNYRQNKEKKLIIRQNLFGYDRVKKDGELYYIANKEQKEAILLIIKMYLQEHKGAREIFKYLNDNNICGKKWSSPKLILDILKNRHYTGQEKYYKLDKNYLTDYKKSYSKEELENISYWEDTPYIEPIISLETYFNIQNEMERKTLNKRGFKVHKRLYSKYLICGICGNHYISQGKYNKSNDACYICKRDITRNNLFCDNHIITETFITEKLQEQANNYKTFLYNFFIENINNLLYLRVYLILAFVNNDNNDYLKLVSEQEEKKEQLKNILLESLKSETSKQLLSEIKETLDKEILEIEQKKNKQQNFKDIIQEKIYYVNSLIDEMDLIQEETKDNYSINDYINELDYIKVYPIKDDKKHLNNVKFEYRLKIENRIYNLFNDLENTDILDYIGSDILTKNNLLYVVKEPTEEEKERAKAYFTQFL